MNIENIILLISGSFLMIFGYLIWHFKLLEPCLRKSNLRRKSLSKFLGGNLLLFGLFIVIFSLVFALFPIPIEYLPIVFLLISLIFSARS